MNTQDTKVHIKLWHKDFWLMSLANLLLTMSAYSLLPILPSWLVDKPFNLSSGEVGMVLGVFGIGVFALGCFCSFLVQHYRRNRVCRLAIAAGMLCSLALCEIDTKSIDVGFASLLLLRFIHGACYGLAKMILASTLIIDTCESFQRTEANYSSAWFSRFSLSLGPVLGLVCSSVFDVRMSCLVSACCGLAALLLVRCVTFPFRAPEENIHVFSLDRFFLLQGWVLFLNLAIISTVVGMMFVSHVTLDFYSFLMCGFLLSLLARKFMFNNADLKSEVVIGLLFFGAALLIILSQNEPYAKHLVPILFGLGIGITFSRFQLFFIKLSGHCQRGTSQSTFLLGCELGVAFGLFLGYTLLGGQPQQVASLSLAFVVMALLMYILYTHRWYIANKNR